MKTKVFAIKTTTENGRLAKTIVFMPRNDLVVINRRILLKQGDYEEGRFTNASPIHYYRDYVLVEQEIVFWVESFGKICEAVMNLSESNTQLNIKL